MLQFAHPIAIGATVLTGAFFGFFFAWSSTIMWGFDSADPRVAIPAMQAANAAVRNALFGVVFFGTAPALALSTGLAFGAGRLAPGLWLAAATLAVIGVIAITIVVHIPMNEALAGMVAPVDAEPARLAWAAFSERWQVWNHLRTGMAGSGLACAAIALTWF